jgi:hypothetical protein
MHWYVSSLSEHTGITEEDGAAKVEPFFDIGAVSGTFQGHAHFFGDGGEKVAENGEGGGGWGHG